MKGHTGMAIGAGPSYVNAVMGPAPPVSERENVRKESLQIITRHDIDVEESQQTPVSRPDSWSMHYDRTDQAPYCSNARDKMMTQTSLLTLPKNNASRDLAFFLRTTGPTAPHRRPSKIEHPPRALTTSRNALRFFKFGHKRSAPGFGDTRFYDEGGLLSEKKRCEQETYSTESCVVQGVSSTGQKYLAIQPQADEEQTLGAHSAREPSPGIIDSQVSISYAPSISSPNVFETWTYADESFRDQAYSLDERSLHQLHQDDGGLRVVNLSSPVTTSHHPSSPPTPEPVSAVSMADSYKTDLVEHPARRSVESTRAHSSPLIHSTTTSLPLPKVSLPHEMFPVRHPRGAKDIDLKHPSPRRFASHPVLLQRASSIASSMDPHIASDSPGPPPRSPLRLRRDQRSIDDAMACQSAHKPPSRVATSIADIEEYSSDVLPIKPTVTTDCTGPIKRPDSGGKNPLSRSNYAISTRKERAERTRAKKLRDKPTTSQLTDTTMISPPRLSRQRLKKARPQISIPELRPAPLTTRSPSTASSNTSWKKIREFTRTPVSAVPSETTPISIGETAGYTPISPKATSGSMGTDTLMTLSPVMLVAEEVPIAKAKGANRPVRMAAREGKTYAPRPRSASIPRSALKRRSLGGSRTTTRANSPAPDIQDDEAPPLPSPPPNRRLPPTPPASGSEKPKRVKALTAAEIKKDLPPTPTQEPGSQATGLPDRGAGLQQLPQPAQQINDSSKDRRNSSHFDQRLAALEHHNKLLSAALVAVLRTNGERNLPFAELAALEKPKSPAAWEARLARRKASDAASNTASSSNGSALEMYMSTRRGSRHGF